MKKYIANIKKTEFGWVEFKAVNKKEAKERVFELEQEGMVQWNKEAVEAVEIKEIKAIKPPNPYNADHPDRKKAIRIIHSISSLEDLEGEAYYEVEDLITRIISGKE